MKGEADTTRSLINRISMSQAIFSDHVMRKEKLEHLRTTGRIEGKHSRGKDVGWTNKVGRVTEALKATRNRDIWKVRITYAKEQVT